jgi:hypothetical protein
MKGQSPLFATTIYAANMTQSRPGLISKNFAIGKVQSVMQDTQGYPPNPQRNPGSQNALFDRSVPAQKP